MKNKIVSILSICLVVFLAAEANAVIFKGWAEGSWTTVVAGGIQPDGAISAPYSVGASGIDGDYQLGDPDPVYWTDLIYHRNNDDIGNDAVFDWGLTYDPSGVNDPSLTDPDQNSFTFDGSFSDGETKVGFDTENPDDNPVLFGEFDYYNGSTYYSRHIYGVSLSVNFHVLDENELFVADFNMVFDFGIENISNDPNPTADNVRILNQSALNETFSYDGIDYLFNVKGFSEDLGKTTKLLFSSDEGDSSFAGLYAEISPIPEPTTMILFGTGLIGIALCGGRSLKKRKEGGYEGK